jgi:hypothetical protein
VGESGSGLRRGRLSLLGTVVKNTGCILSGCSTVPGEPLILCFRNPLNNPSFRAIEEEEEIIVRKRALLLRFNAPSS